MCGIAGVVAPAGLPGQGETAARLEAMAAAVAHRGPDDRGVWHDRHAGLAATRLAIIDPTPAGHQPMQDERGETTVVFNGEIYNFRDLRRELEAAGHRFGTRSDTESILHGYREWGDGVVARLRGMFALAVWDGPHRRLLLARDRLGQKPLYYTSRDGALVFGSEIKALRVWPGVGRAPDYEAIHQYLTLRYVPGEHTAFAGVARLPPAHLLTVDATGNIQRRRYWRRPGPDTAAGGGRDVEGDIVERFDEAVRLRLAADVPVGAFLSGGIDSSSVVAAMSAAAAGPVRTFTLGFEDPAIDERAAARLVADRYGTRHTEVAAAVDLPAIVPRIVWHYGEPFADPVAIATYLLAEQARREVKVVLTGDGGDEIFLGYRRHAAAQAAAWLDRAPRPLRASIARAARRAMAGRSQSRAARFLAALDRQPAERHAGWVSYLTDEHAAGLYDGALADFEAQRAADLFRPWFTGPGEPARQAAAADLDTFLPDELLVRLDVATMAHGLEARSPFLDHELVELAVSLPARVRMPRLRNKGLLRTVMADRLPGPLLRRPKLGFPMPLGLRRPPAEHLVRDVLSPEAVAARGIMRPEAVGRFVDRHYRGGADLEQQLWTLVMLELWFRMWIDPAG